MKRILLFSLSTIMLLFALLLLSYPSVFIKYGYYIGVGLAIIATASFIGTLIENNKTSKYEKGNINKKIRVLHIAIFFTIVLILCNCGILIFAREGYEHRWHNYLGIGFLLFLLLSAYASIREIKKNAQQ